jgi:streptogramin lyase
MRAFLLSLAIIWSSSLLASPPRATTYAPLNGIVQSGPTPISGAHVYLMAATVSVGGTPLPSRSIPFPNSQTDLDGNYYTPSGDGKTRPSGRFTIAGYNCSPDEQVYLLAAGGNPSLAAATVNNTAIALISAIGPCPADPTATPPSYVINEATTVASVYALSGFLTDSILNSCVSSASSTSTGCRSLFLDATPPDANTWSTHCNAPQDTVCALRNIIDHPDHKVSELYDLGARSGIFQPIRPGLPTNPDWTLVISYRAPNLVPNVSPFFLAVDREGNIWATAFGGKSVTEFGPQGQVNLVIGDAANKTSFYGLSYPLGIAIDQRDNVWVGNNDDASTGKGGALSAFSKSISLGGQSGFPAPTNAPSVAVDAKGMIWLLTLDAQLCNFANSGLSGWNMGDSICDKAPNTGPYNFFSGSNAGDRTSYGLAIDKDNYVWIASRPAKAVLKLDVSKPNQPVVLKPIQNVPSVLSGPIFLASNTFGGKTEIWVSNIAIDPATGDATGGSLVAFDQNGNQLLYPGTTQPIIINNVPIDSPQPYPARDTLCLPYQMIFDGAGTLWVANQAIGNAYCNNASLSHYDHNGQSLSRSGVAWGAFTDPEGIAVDPSGNIWVASGGSQFISEVVGVAVPVSTPLSPTSLSQRP